MINLMGGGPGMVLKIEPIARAISKIKSKISNLSADRQDLENYKIILFSPSGKQFTQNMARNWAKKVRQYNYDLRTVRGC